MCGIGDKLMKKMKIMIAMKKNYLFVITFWGLSMTSALAQKNWVGTSTNWNAAANWLPAGVPSATDQVFVGVCTTCPVLTANLSVSNLTVQDGGKLTIGANTLTATDIFAASNAEIISAGGTIDANRTGFFSGNTITGNLTLRINFINPANRNAYLGAQGGGNTFKNDYTLEVETGDWTAYIVANSLPDTYKGKAYFKNKGMGYLMITNNTTTNPTVFEQDVSFINDNTTEGKIQIGVNGGKINCLKAAQFTDNSTSPYSFMSVNEATFIDVVTITANRSEVSFGYVNLTVFKKNVNVSNGNDAKFIFGNGGNVQFESLSNLAVSGAMNAGQFRFKNTEFLSSATPFSLQLGTGTTLPTPVSKTLVRLGNDVTFSRPVDIKADYIEYNRATFNQAVTLERTGPIIASQTGFTGAGVCPGWSNFNGKATFKNTYGDDWTLGAYVGDKFNGDVIFTDGNNIESRYTYGYLRPALSDNNVFNGNITLNILSKAGGYTQGGIEFGANTGVSTLAATKTITTNVVDFGLVILRGIRQLDPNTNQTINMPNGRLIFNSNVSDNIGTKFSGKLTATAGQIEINNSEFFQPTFIKKLNGDNTSVGNNKFFSKVNIQNQAPTYGDIKFITANSFVKN
jgi:hypothetical protein